jgi:SAM-dependent methyltransferase
MRRATEPELLDVGKLPDAVVERAYRDLTRLHRVLGDTGRIVRAIRTDPLPVHTVLDIGCGHGGMLADVCRRTGVRGIGIDLRPPANARVPIVRADAIRDPLPYADIAYSVCLGHHLSEEDLAQLILNVGGACHRFLLVDLVRHWLPLAMFRVFVAPFFSRVAVVDGIASVRRAYTPPELADVVHSTGVRFHHSVAPGYTSQTFDITY